MVWHRPILNISLHVISLPLLIHFSVVLVAEIIVTQKWRIQDEKNIDKIINKNSFVLPYHSLDNGKIFINYKIIVFRFNR